MPYSRGSRRAPFKRTFSRKRRAPYRRRAMVRTVQAVINRNLEKKFQDLAYTTLNIDNSGVALVKLTAINQDVTDTARIGDKLKVLSFKSRWQFIAGDTTNYIRVLMFQWHPDDSQVVPTAARLLQVVTATSFYNHDNGSNFSVIKDFNFTLNPENPNRNINMVTRFGKKAGRMRWVKNTIKYDASGMIGNDQLYMLFISDSGAAPHPTVTGNSRMTFTDG